MKYKYNDINGRLIVESNSLVHFNDELFPAWNTIVPVEEEVLNKTSIKKEVTEKVTKVKTKEGN